MVALAECFVMVRPNMATFKAETDAGLARAGLGNAGTAHGKAFGTSFGKAASGLMVVGFGVGLGALLASSVKAAGDFQAQMVRLTTSAGETGTAVSGNLKKVSEGILAMAGPTGTSLDALGKAMYTVESGSFHGAEGLKVLRAAAEGAKAENADLTMVADAVTSSLVDYHLGADQAALVTTKLVAATAAGKTTFQQLTGSLHSILPIASAAHVSLDDILGDLASMTLHGMSADQATQNLADTIRHMTAPTAVQAKELSLLGLTTNQLATDLKTMGLSGTLGEISDRIAKMMPAGGEAVILQMKTALNGLSPAVRDLGQRLIEGSLSAKDYRNEARALDPISAAQAMSFSALAAATHRIGDQQVSGAQVMQTYAGALQKATGDATGMNVALMLTGENSATTANAIKAVAGATTEAGNHVAGWGVIQETFNFKLASLHASAGALGVTLGTALLPTVTHMVTAVSGILPPMTSWIAAHSQLTVVIGSSLIGLVAFVTATVAIIKIVGVLKTVVTALRLAAIAQGLWTAAMTTFQVVTSWTLIQVVALETWSKIIAVSTKAWAAAQWLLNLAMDANPVGLVILAVVALIGVIVLIATKTTWFQTAWKATWGFIKDAAAAVANWFLTYIWPTMSTVFNSIAKAATWLWNTILKPAFAAWQAEMRLVAGVAMWLWLNIISPVAGGVGRILTAMWIVIQILFKIWQAEMRAVASVAMWLWHNVIEPVVAGIAAGFTRNVAVVKAVLEDFRRGFSVIWSWVRDNIFQPLYDWVVVRIVNAFRTNVAIVKAVWEDFRRGFAVIWNWVRDNIFTPLANVISTTVPRAFDTGVRAITAAWDKVRDAARVPVAFVVNSIINPLIGGFNNVAKAFGVSTQVAKIGGFAEGGQIRGPGTGTSDSILAQVAGGPLIRVSNGEYIIPAHRVREEGVSFWDMLAGKSPSHNVRRPGDGSEGFAFADGGLIGFLKDAWSALMDPAKFVTGPINAMIGKIPGSGMIKEVVVGASHKLLDGLTAWISGKSGAGTISGKVPTGLTGNIGAAMQFLLAQNGKPYGWAMAGPSSYDCCIVGGVRIYGPDGAKSIQDVRAGDRVYSYVDGNLEPHTVVKAWQSLHQPVFEVRTRNRSVTASANHPFLRVIAVGDEQVQHWEDAEWPGVPTTVKQTRCLVSTCTKPFLANGMCAMHRARWNKNGDPRIKYVGRVKTWEDADWPGVPESRYGSRKGAQCSLSTCTEPVHANDMCATHQERWRKHGDPRITLSARERFEAQWAPLEELQRGDLLVQPRLMPTEAKPDPTLSDGTAVDVDVAWLIGASIGDGTVTERSLRLCLYGDDRDRATQVIVSRWGGKPTHGKSYGLVSSNVQLAHALTDLGMRRLGPDKRVPDAVWTWPLDLQRAFLDGYCDADGHRPSDQKRHGERTYSSAARELIEDVRAMHILLGDPVSNITVNKRTKPITINGKLVKNPRALHTIAVWPNNGHGEARMRNHPGLAAWLDAGDFTLTTVLGIEPRGEEDTWDLNVEGAHNFVADGVVVHNSGIVSAVWNVLHGRSPYSHTFSTATEAPYFPIPGPGGVLTAGWAGAGQRGGGSVGHTAGVLAGYPFESTGDRGVHMGSGVTPLTAFAHMGHYALGGLVPGPIGQPQAAIVHGGERVISARDTQDGIRLHPADIDALAAAIGQVVVAGVGAGNYATATTANMYMRGG